jgi:hypothetical protein
MNKQYKIRVYVPNNEIGIIVNEAIDSNLLRVVNSCDGVNGMLAIHDGFISSKGLKLLISLGVRYFPLDNYGDFIITCPNCGERIDDDMILLIYDENLLSGYNINCNRKDCGCQMANVEFILD